MRDLALRSVRRFLEIEGTQHATVLGAVVGAVLRTEGP
jgi:hypothetical protein